MLQLGPCVRNAERLESCPLVRGDALLSSWFPNRAEHNTPTLIAPTALGGLIRNSRRGRKPYHCMFSVPPVAKLSCFCRLPHRTYFVSFFPSAVSISDSLPSPTSLDTSARQETATTRFPPNWPVVLHPLNVLCCSPAFRLPDLIHTAFVAGNRSSKLHPIRVSSSTP